MNAVRIFLQSLFKFEGGVGKKMKDPQFFRSRIWGPSKVKRRVLGGGLL